MKRNRIGSAAAGLLVALALAGPARAAEPRLTVGVCNYAKVPEQILRPAAAAAEDIFRKAGVDSEWILREAEPDRPVQLNVRVLHGRSRNVQAPDAFGAALVAGTSSNLADVFYGLVEDRAFTGPDISMLLANVMAHEVGHLLLGAKHSPRGIMCGPWAREDLKMAIAGQLRFDLGQALRLRAEVAARLGLPSLTATR